VNFLLIFFLIFILQPVGLPGHEEAVDGCCRGRHEGSAAAAAAVRLNSQSLM
jgi:hypothetical protein